MGVTQDDGQVLETRDGGASWAQVYRGNVWPEVMQFVDGRHGWMTGCILSTGISGHCDRPLLATPDGGRTWSPRRQGGGEIVSLSFVSATNGWVLSDPCATLCETAPAELFATADGGDTWSAITLPHPGNHPLSVQRFDEETGWVLTGDWILATTDGGRSWTRAAMPCDGVPGWSDSPAFQPRPGPLFFASTTTGWLGCTLAIGGGQSEGALYRTDNGGVSWHLLAVSGGPRGAAPPGIGQFPTGVAGLDFRDGRDGWSVCGCAAQGLWRTSDGGRDWRFQFFGVAAPAFTHVRFIDTLDGFVWNATTLLRTRDGGMHWARLVTR